ncbi:MAG: glucose-6-phosphate isomerase [Rikenellaceae bacterium]
MIKLTVALNKVYNFIPKMEIAKDAKQFESFNEALHNGTCKGNDFLGWVNLPSSIDPNDLADINATAAKLKANSEFVIVIGIGGSYLGAKAVIEALGNSFDAYKKERDTPAVVFAGQNISEDYTQELIDTVKDRDFSVVVISKSGTTTEPAIAFRIFKEMLEEKYGKAGAAERIVAVTDRSRGALRELATTEGYKTYVIDDNIGGRFSVLTPVGLLPLAVGGVDINALVQGAIAMEKATDPSVKFDDNVSMQYAAARTALYNSGKKIELLASFEPKMQYVNEWWKQLYGESEGKDGKGLFPASVVFSSDLHSMGQYIQDGERSLFETIVTVKKPHNKVVIKSDAANLDGLNFLTGRRIGDVNYMAELGTTLAHVDGGVPVVNVTIEELSAYSIGELIYFFEKACGISGLALGVNPFDQPGVEAYKANMFALLNKPGFEAQSEAIKKRIETKI